MDWSLYLAFVAATTVLILIPGPNVALIVSNSIAFGTRRGCVTVAGTSSAMVIQLAVTALGMTSFLLAASAWFEWLRWIGVAYLIYLGVQQWRTVLDGARRRGGKTRSLAGFYWQGFAVSATNPKTLLFYAAFFPQFVDPAAAPATQLTLLSVTFLVIATVLDGGYALAAGRVRGWFEGARRERIRNRITGSLLVGAGVGLAFARRS